MKKLLSVLLAAIMLVSVFTTAFNAFALSTPEEGWYKDDSGKWHFAVNGEDIADDTYYDEETEKLYYFNSDGILVENKWTHISAELDEGMTVSVWIYSVKGGALAMGWKKIDGKWYYFIPVMLSGGGYYIEENDKAYVFEKSGALTTRTGWVSFKEQLEDGSTRKFWYYVGKGGVATTGWKKIDGSWYYFDSDGVMLDDGVYKLENGIYFFNSNGKWDSKKSGWVKDYGDWYYFENGRGITGWKQYKNNWYCFDVYDGHMYAGGSYEVFKHEEDETGVFYIFEDDGRLTTKTGWRQFTYDTILFGEITAWHYAEKGGKAAIGWKKLNGNWYYFDEYSSMMISAEGYEVDGKVYLFEKSGKLTSKTGWVSMNQEFFDGSSHKYWYYVGKGGVCATGWKKIKDVWYFFDETDGSMLDDGVYALDDGIYFFNSNGKWDSEKEGLVEDYGDLYYFVDGKGVTGWLTIDGEERYFDPYSGAMARNDEVVIDGYIYEFDDEGNGTLIGEADEDYFEYNDIDFVPPLKAPKAARANTAA